MQKKGSGHLTKAVVFCFCPELLQDTEGGHVSRTKQEGAVLISYALLLMRSCIIIFVNIWMWNVYYRGTYEQVSQLCLECHCHCMM